MKKIFALMIALAFAMCLFTACGDDDTYRQPGTGTTLGDVTSTTPIDDANGSYSADPDGDVNQTTDDNILEDGINDIENGIENGLNDIEQGIDDLGDGAEEMFDGNDNMNGVNGTNGANDMNGMNGTNGIGNDADPTGVDSENNNNNNAGYTNGSTNGNSR